MKSPPTSPVIPTPASPTPSTSSSASASSSSKKLPKFLRSKALNRRKDSTGSVQSTDVILESPTDDEGEDPFVSIPSSGANDSGTGEVGKKGKQKARNHSLPSSPLAIPSNSSSVAVPNAPPSPSPAHKPPSRMSSWLGSPSSAASSLPSMLTSHAGSLMSKHLSLPTRRLSSTLLSNANANRSTASVVMDPASVQGAGAGGTTKRLFDKAFRYLMDSDAGDDGCREDIWLLGRRYAYSPDDAPGDKDPANTLAKWPDGFLDDFQSRIWLTYRSGFEEPLRSDMMLTDLPPPSLTGTLRRRSSSSSSASVNPVKPNQNRKTNGVPSPSPSSSPQSQRWGGGLLHHFGIHTPKTYTSDAGWGCMVRTAQCLLAEAVSRIVLGRDFLHTSLGTPYEKVLSLFLDTPSPHSPFSLHRFALAGRQHFGKDVGTWFGPQAAGGSIRVLVDALASTLHRVREEEDGEEDVRVDMGAVVAEDGGALYVSDIFSAASPSPSHPAFPLSSPSSWQRPVLLLFPTRLGLSRVTPTYHASLLHLFRLKWTLGVAGGRPGSSYWFVGAQGGSDAQDREDGGGEARGNGEEEGRLVYLDPHYARASVVPARPGVNGQVNGAASKAKDKEAGSVFTEDDLSTFRCPTPRKMKLSDMDPSMLVGFLVSSLEDLNELRASLDSMPGKSKMLSILDERPRWREMDEDGGEDDFVLDSSTDVTGTEVTEREGNGAEGKANGVDKEKEDEFFEMDEEMGSDVDRESVRGEGEDR